MNNELDSVNLLFRNILDKPHYSGSIIILLRTILSDIITIKYVNLKGIDRNGNINLMLNIKQCYADHIRYTLHNEDVYKVVLEITNEEWEDIVTHIKIEYKDYFDENGLLLPDYQRWTSVGKMAFIIKKSLKKDQPVHFLKEAFQLYDIFSKYEHLGEFSYRLVHRAFHQEEQVFLLQEYHQSVIILLHQYEILLRQFFKKDQGEYLKFLELVKPIYEIDFNV